MKYCGFPMKYIHDFHYFHVILASSKTWLRMGSTSWLMDNNNLQQSPFNNPVELPILIITIIFFGRLNSQLPSTPHGNTWEYGYRMSLLYPRVCPPYTPVISSLYPIVIIALAVYPHPIIMDSDEQRIRIVSQCMHYDHPYLVRKEYIPQSLGYYDH